MLNDKLRNFFDLVNRAAAVHGLNAKAVADEIIREAFPETTAAAEIEGADAMLRNGVVAFIAQHFKRTPPADGRQLKLDIPEPLTPIVAKLKAAAHYVESLGQYVPVPILIANPPWLDDARKYKRRKGEETLDEAAVLDELYVAVLGRR
ncbi:hypothetical protein [Sinorhizobium meliloti]|uniref:hypothetical protein n=1 Tax=Rhizobium meliloti TaxID=382 RepID=UPI000B4A1FA7|nr:hypothetical protein [Sinorhizobium meliloti]ASP83577.1 hypothetical protein CDO26_02320 [Sinorhizobium meliloti]MQW26472.1 hypothetical protein [Sinorhizobium meliloti]RVJ69200.1 hypothetical protein CN171_23705 [Sinorhizobium meliloti]